METHAARARTIRVQELRVTHRYRAYDDAHNRIRRTDQFRNNRMGKKDRQFIVVAPAKSEKRGWSSYSVPGRSKVVDPGALSATSVYLYVGSMGGTVRTARGLA